MAVEIKSGDLKHRVVFKQPTSSLNDEREKVTTYTSQIYTWAAIKRFNKNRTTEAHADALIGSLEFYVRSSTDRKAITEEWLLNHDSKDFVIHQIEPVEMSDTKETFIRFTAKSKERQNAVATGNGAVNFTDFSFDDHEGVMTFTGDADSLLTQMDFKNVPDNGFSYVNAENNGFSYGAFDGNVAEEVTYLTPGQIKIRWRKISQGPSYTPQTAWSEKIITIARLQKRWYRIFRFVSGNPFEIYPGFVNLKVYNINGDLIGTYSTIEDLIAGWNADAANAHFPIVDVRTLNGFYEVRIDPDASELVYPFHYLTTSF